MKLIEIFEPSVSSVKTNRKFKANSSPSTMKNELGRGHYSIVSDDSSDPHLVKKRQIVRHLSKINYDAYVLFAKYVMDHKLWDNIHFPRIYSTKSIEDKAGTTAHKWKMEKLEPLSSLSGNEFEYLINRTFSDRITDNITGPHSFGDAIEDAVTYNRLSSIKDESVRDALVILSNMFRELNNGKTSNIPYKIRYDIHGNNIMVRRTSTGLQLVITDPFA